MALTDSVAARPTQAQPDDPSPALEDVLLRAAAVLTDDRAREVLRLVDRWRSRLFVVLIVGEFKRGKSTLLNALVGRELLPTGVAPVTTVPTRVRSGSRTRAQVRFRDGRQHEIRLDEIRGYVDESHNPSNHRDVLGVDVEVPYGPTGGVELVDVPGLGSAHAHNTEAALAVLPEADAALVVASGDPPVGEAELRLLRRVRDHAARVDVVLNKIDYLDEAGRRTAEDFTRRTLAQHGHTELAVWPVSARDGLAARASGDELGWRQSGMQALAASLARFVEDDRAALLARSLAKKAGRLVGQETALVEMRLAAAERSSESLREMIRELQSRRRSAKRDADEDRLIFRRRLDVIFAGYAERAAEAWRSPRAALEARLLEMLAQGRGNSRSEAGRAMNVAARQAAESFVEAFVPSEGRRLASAYGQLVAEVGAAAADRAQAIWRWAAALLPFEPPEVELPSAPPAPSPDGFELGSLRLLLDDLEGAAARLLPKGAALRRLAAEAREEAEGRYGRAVEQSRDAFYRAYEEHFGALLAAYAQASEQAAVAVESALAVAEEQARSLDADRRANARADEQRRVELAHLRDSLKRLDGASGGRP